jgi:hypothetical protein
MIRHLKFIKFISTVAVVVRRMRIDLCHMVDILARNRVVGINTISLILPIRSITFTTVTRTMAIHHITRHIRTYIKMMREFTRRPIHVA